MEKPFNPPELMTNEQIASIKAEIEDIKQMINAGDETRRSDVGYFDHARTHLDIDEVKKAIRAREAQLEKYTPKKLTGEKANKALAYAKKLETWIAQNMPRETFVLFPRDKDPSTKAAEFERAVNRQVEWMKNGQRAINIYHHIMRRIDPDAPMKDFNKLVRERA